MKKNNKEKINKGFCKPVLLVLRDVVASNCKYCNNKLCDAQRFSCVCFKCGKKPV